MFRRSRRSQRSQYSQRSRRSFEDSSEDEEEQPNTSNRSQSRRQTQSQSQSQVQKKKGLSDDEMNAAVGAAITYILRANEGKHHIVKANIQKVALQQSKFYADIMKEVEKRMKDVFGFKLHQFEPGKYVVSNLITNSIPHITIKAEAKKKQTLLFLILSHIFMCEDACLEDSLWMFLNELGIVTHELERDPYFGNIRSLINDEFIKQKYIEKIKQGDRENEYFEYKWGVRAEQELTLRTVMEFVEKIYNTKMDTFKNQYNAMLLRERTETRNEGDRALQPLHG